MHSETSNEPLLTLRENPTTCDPKKKPFLITLLKWVLKVTMWSVFVAWVVLIFLFPTDYVTKKYFQGVSVSEGSVFGRKAFTFLIFSAPILVIAVLGAAYIVLAGKEDDDNEHIQGKKNPRNPRFRLWTFPVLVDGPFGVVSAAEIIGIVLFSLYVVWAFYAATMHNLEIAPLFHLSPREQSILLLELTGLRLGMIGIFCLGFLFLPVSRGSLLLRLVDIPFEHATRYHVWLGHLTMAIFALHGLVYVVGWSMNGQLIEKLTQWENIGIANLPGVVSLLAGLVMWATSLPGARRQNFELFFYTHQLYIVFVVFLALHVGDFIFCYAAGGIFLFMLDRFLRFFQSRKTVDVLSARSFPCGTVELVLSKPANMHYNALGWIFLQIRELSWLQWHPFSVSSSPLDGKRHVAILIKVLGDWTEKLERRISRVSNMDPEKRSSYKLTASVEGPYGHESPYHLTYENLILVAGGIGISPFLAILSDVLRRIEGGKPCLPKNVLIIWAVKTSDELPLLLTLDMESICPTFSESLNLDIQTYVTRQSEPSLKKGKLVEPVNSATFAGSGNRGMSVLAGTGNIVWSGIYVAASIMGLVITAALVDSLYINPYKVECWWYKGLLLVACMAASNVLFGGAVIGFWHLWEKTTCEEEEDETRESHQIMRQKQRTRNSLKSLPQEQYTHKVRYGKRPNFKGIFESMADEWGNVDIGVIICGPPSLQTSVARECRAQNLKRSANKAVFHFNSHSFDL